MKDPNTNDRSWIWIECHQVSQPILAGLFLAVSMRAAYSQPHHRAMNQIVIGLPK
jgi:hypothetical protein